MSEDVKVYHVETLDDYNDLMVKLEEQGYRWRSGDLPTYDDDDFWDDYEMNTCIQAYEYDKSLTYGSLRNENCKENIIKHKAKGVEKMEKVVVPQFVADWYEENKNDYILGAILDKMKRTKNENIVNWRGSCSGRYKNNLGNAQEVIAKMYLYGYEVEEEKKYYWRKKKEYMFEFENEDRMYLNLDRTNNKVCFSTSNEITSFQTLFTETEVKRLVSEEDFNKLEEVEITE